jgi:hypothetical protein
MSNAAKLAHTLLIDAPKVLRKEPFAWAIVRDLNEADMEVLQNPPKTGIKAPSLQRIRNTHHMLARLLAEGKKPTDISMITGFSPGRISSLQSDPMFVELMAYYSAQVESQYLDVHARLADLGVTSLEELRERIEETPEKFSVRELLEIMKETLDRSAAPSKGGGGGKTNIEIKFVGAAASATEIADEPAKGTILDLNIEPEQ